MVNRATDVFRFPRSVVGSGFNPHSPVNYRLVIALTSGSVHDPLVSLRNDSHRQPRRLDGVLRNEIPTELALVLR